MSRPKSEISNARIGGLNGFAAIVSSLIVGGDARVRILIEARGLESRHIDLSPAQARRAIRDLGQAIHAAEREARLTRSATVGASAGLPQPAEP